MESVSGQTVPVYCEKTVGLHFIQPNLRTDESNETESMTMNQHNMKKLLGLLITVILIAALPLTAHAAKPVKASKERLVLMPLRVAEEDRALQGAMETALVEGLQQKYEVFSGEQVAQKAHEIFMKESRSTAKKECDETRCMQGIAEAFQAELIATANVTKQGGGYFLALSVQNIFDNKVEYSKTLTCEGCNAFKVVDKLKELVGTPESVAAAPTPEAPHSKVNLNDPDGALWAEAQKGNTAEDYQVYLDTYPKGKSVPFAKARIKKLNEAAQGAAEQQEQKTWDTAQKDSSENSYVLYLKGYPQGRYAALATSRIKKLQKEIGSIVVTSKESEIEVWIDDRNIGVSGSSKEMLVPNLTRGRHQLRAIKNNITWEQYVEVAPGAKTLVPVFIDSTQPILNVKLLEEVVTRVNSDYVINLDLSKFLIGALRGIEMIVPKGAIITSTVKDGAILSFVAINNTPIKVTFAFPKTAIDLQRMINFGSILASEFVPSLDQAKLEKSIINEALANLDPHSAYMDADGFKEFQVGSQGEFVGIGIEVEMEDGQIKVLSPIEDAPAYHAGIKSGDLIIKLDGELVKGLSLNDAVKRMRGKPGTNIALTIVRKGDLNPIVITVARASIKVQSVKSKIVEPGYAFVRVTQFQEHTGENLASSLEAIFKLSEGNLKGLVLDLRNDPGGLLTTAVAVSAAFLPKDALVVYTKGRTKDSIMRLTASSEIYLRGKNATDYLKNLPEIYKKLPMVILVNSGSAAASEIVAGALQDHKRAVIMGTQSFGRGSLQTILPLSNSTAIRLTTARYYTPSGRSIQNQGIVPDILVEDPVSADLSSTPRLREVDLDHHLTNDRQSDEKSYRADTKTTQKSQRNVKEGDYSTAKIPEFGTKNDYQLNQALDMLKAKYAGK